MDIPCDSDSVAIPANIIGRAGLEDNSAAALGSQGGKRGEGNFFMNEMIIVLETQWNFTLFERNTR